MVSQFSDQFSGKRENKRKVKCVSEQWHCSEVKSGHRADINITIDYWYRENNWSKYQ
jgi:hypothetical protein